MPLSTSLLSASTSQNPLPLHSTQLSHACTPSFSTFVVALYQLYSASIFGADVCRPKAYCNVDSAEVVERIRCESSRSSERERIASSVRPAKVGRCVERRERNGK